MTPDNLATDLGCPALNTIRETQAHNSLSVVLTSGYDAADNRTSLKATIGGTADFHNVYQFDALSRMVRIEQTGQSGGNTVAEKRIDLAYNAANQFTGIQRYKDPGAPGTHSKDTTTFADYDWTYDAMGRVTLFSFTFLVGTSGTSAYSYDNTSQLVGADHSNQADENHTFDAAGNRTDTGYSTGDNNRMTSDGTFNYTHDDEGNQLTRTRISSASADDYLVEYTWDHRNRLTNIKFKNNAGTVTQELSYEYDVFNRRIEQSLDADGAGSGSAVVTRWIHDGEHLSLEFNGSNVLTHRFVHGPVTDQWLAVEVAATGVVYWPLADNLGSVRDIIINDGTSQNHLDYSAWGAVTAETNTSFEFLFGFTGAIREEATGLNYHRARYYDPKIGQWLSEDPIGFQAGDYNVSRYVGNDPTNYVDPDGLDRRVGEFLFHGWIEVDVYDQKGNVRSTVELHFSPGGYTIEPHGSASAYPTSGASIWYITTQAEDELLVKLWKNLEEARRQGPWYLSWNPANNCWVPLFQNFHYGVEFEPEPYPASDPSRTQGLGEP